MAGKTLDNLAEKVFHKILDGLDDKNSTVERAISKFISSSPYIKDEIKKIVEEAVNDLE